MYPPLLYSLVIAAASVVALALTLAWATWPTQRTGVSK